MKKMFLFVFAFIFVGSVFAYTPSTKDTANLAHLKSQLSGLIEKNNINLRDFYNQLRILQSDYSQDARLNYMLGNLKDHLYDNLSAQKTSAKILSKDSKQEFLDQYLTGISKDISGSLNNCTGRYNTLDDISFSYDFPTALTIATWYRESTCAYHLPNNKNGPFQITSKDYGTGEITQNKFIETVVDFMEFTKNKFGGYSNLTGKLSYSEFDLTGISNFAALYNGGNKSGDIILPNEAKYLYDGYGEEFSGATKYGIFPQFLKALERELSQ
ncbi:MAG: hypothetical protein M0P94_02510 [Candidatus Absconditabacterales bacterium]|nr:hypothetical protein [Candidatus Absconditabacterales bacterium]